MVGKTVPIDARQVRANSDRLRRGTWHITSCRRLPSNKAGPSGEIAISRERLCTTDGSDERSCVKRANAGNYRQPARDVVPFCFGREFGIECRNPFV
jgi:hypothetical protein